MLKQFKWLAGPLLMLLLLQRPEAAVNGAREAMAQWYYAVAPSMFPFMALLPLLTCDEALGFYEAALGGVMNRLFRLPGAAASGLVVGMLAGSPAGCAAVRAVAGRSKLSSAQATRLAAACCGLSPGFLITGVGVSMLNSAAYGHVLLRAQALTQLTLLLLFRRLPDGADRPAVPGEEEREPRPMRGAVLSALTVCGYMVLFGAISRCVGALAGGAAGDGLLCLIDVTSGASVVSGLPLPADHRLLLLSAVTGFGGACVCAQNLSVLRGCGIDAGLFIALRLAAALLNAAFVAVQLKLPALSIQFSPVPLRLSCLCACLIAIPILVRLKRTVS